MEDYEYDDDFEEEHISGESSRKPSHVATHFKTPKKRKKTKSFGHSPHDRIISAKDQEIKALHSKLNEVKKQLQEATLENKTMKRQQIRYEKELKNIGKQEGDLPNILQRHKEEVKNLRAQIQRTQLNNVDLQKRINDMSSELWKSHERVKKLDAMSKRRDLPERERLVFQLQEFREEMNEKERQITKLERSLEVHHKTHSQEVKGLLSKNKSMLQRIEEMKTENRHIRWQLKDKERLLDVTNIYTQRYSSNIPTLPLLPLTDDQSTQTTSTLPPCTEYMLIRKPKLTTTECQTDSSWLTDLITPKVKPSEETLLMKATPTKYPVNVTTTASAGTSFNAFPVSHVITTTPTLFNTTAAGHVITTTPTLFNTTATGHVITTAPTNITATGHVINTAPTNITATGHVITATPTLFNSSIVTITTSAPIASAGHVTTATPTTTTPSFTKPTTQQTFDIKSLLFTDHAPKPPLEVKKATPTLPRQTAAADTQTKNDLLQKLFPNQMTSTNDKGSNKLSSDVATPLSNKATFEPTPVKPPTEHSRQATPLRQTTPINTQTKNDLLNKLFPMQRNEVKQEVGLVAKETSSTSTLSWQERIENMHHGLPSMASDEDRYGNTNRRKGREESGKSSNTSIEENIKPLGRRGMNEPSLFGDSKIFGNGSESKLVNPVNPTFGGGDSAVTNRGGYPWETKVDISSDQRRVGVVTHTVEDDIEELTIT